jgi:hypothetical protein
VHKIFLFKVKDRSRSIPKMEQGRSCWVPLFLLLFASRVYAVETGWIFGFLDFSTAKEEDKPRF